MDHISGKLKESEWIASLSIPYNVKVIEKHISLDLDLEIEDYVSALSPNNFKTFVQNIRNAEKYLGNDKYILSKEETQYRSKAFKVVVAKKRINANSIIKKIDLTLLRVPYNPKEKFYYKIDQVVGKFSTKRINKFQFVNKKYIK